MAEFTITKWRCDRCGCVQDTRPTYGTPKFGLKLSAQEEWDSSDIIWVDVCGPCNRYLEKLHERLGQELGEEKKP
jgi:hypothetical protein